MRMIGFTRRTFDHKPFLAKEFKSIVSFSYLMNLSAQIYELIILPKT